MAAEPWITAKDLAVLIGTPFFTGVVTYLQQLSERRVRAKEREEERRLRIAESAKVPDSHLSFSVTAALYLDWEMKGPYNGLCLSLAVFNRSAHDVTIDEIVVEAGIDELTRVAVCFEPKGEIELASLKSTSIAVLGLHNYYPSIKEPDEDNVLDHFTLIVRLGSGEVFPVGVPLLLCSGREPSADADA